MIKRVNSPVKRQFSSAETTQDEERMKVGDSGRGTEVLKRTMMDTLLTSLASLWGLTPGVPLGTFLVA